MIFKCLILLKYFVAMYPRVFSILQEHVGHWSSGGDGWTRGCQLPDAGQVHVRTRGSCRRQRGHVQGQLQVPIIMIEVLNECSIL